MDVTTLPAHISLDQSATDTMPLSQLNKHTASLDGLGPPTSCFPLLALYLPFACATSPALTLSWSGEPCLGTLPQ